MEYYKRKSDAMTASSLKAGIDDAVSTFKTRLKATYPTQAPFHDEQHRKLSEFLLSNLLGGIGFFHKTSKVDSSSISQRAQIAKVKDKDPNTLFSSVPSMPFFPRGFLWNEDFHLVIILD